MFLAKIVAAALTARGAFRANRLAADIAFSETPDADMPLAACADGRMARTGHLAADFAFAHVMNAERLAAFGALKGAFAADLLTAECARRGMRPPDMLVAAGAGDEAMKTDRAMAEIALNHVNIAGDVAALRALRRATAAKMLAAVQTAEQVRRAICFAAQMATLLAGWTEARAAFGALLAAAGMADRRAAHAADLEARLANGMIACFAQPDRLRLFPAGWALRQNHRAGKEIVMRVNGNRLRPPRSLFRRQRNAVALKRCRNGAEADRLDFDMHLAFLQFVRCLSPIFLLKLALLLLPVYRHIRDFLNQLPVKALQPHHVMMILLGKLALTPGRLFLRLRSRLLEAARINGFRVRFAERKTPEFALFDERKHVRKGCMARKLSAHVHADRDEFFDLFIGKISDAKSQERF